MSYDTLRLIIDSRCNLSCSYCCNKIPEIRNEFRQAFLSEIDWQAYQTVCITGGEPLLCVDKIEAVCKRVPRGALVVLYTNGILLDYLTAMRLVNIGVNAINVGLHKPESFHALIQQVMRATHAFRRRLSVRFHVWEGYRDIVKTEHYCQNTVTFRFWKLNDCSRANEDRVELI
jgi:molybdenum cofactor biosynthesis enzyme MoaA